jgi:hexosaminidase
MRSHAFASYCALALLAAFAAVPARAAGEPVKLSGTQASHGVGIIPEPQSIRLTEERFTPGAATAIWASPSLTDRMPVESLAAGVERISRVRLGKTGRPDGANTISLRLVQPAELTAIPAAHRGEESYTLDVTSRTVEIRAVSPRGLFYGVQSLLELLNAGAGTVKGAAIADWPDMDFRSIHVDLWYHQDRPEYYDRLFEQIARYKLNAVLFEFEDKFLFTRHPTISAPGAMDAAEVKRLVRLAHKYYIDIVPLVQTFGHTTFIAKHPEFAHLREVPMSSWQLCPLKPGTYDLARDMLDEVLDATEGTRYFHIGGDEVEEIGQGKECRAKWGDKAPVESYKHWLQFASGYVKKRGRIPIVWDDMFLKHFKAEDLAGLPSGLVYVRWNYTKGTIPERERMLIKAGLPVWIATAAQNMTPIMPDQNLRVYNNAYLLQEAHSLGIHAMIDTAWEDAGAHPETYWIGFAAGAEYSWSAAKPGTAEFYDKFVRSFYGVEQHGLVEAYDILSGRGFLRDEHNWSKPFAELAMPPLPDKEFGAKPGWNERFGGLVAKAKQMRPRYQRAAGIVRENLDRNLQNGYSLEILLLAARTQLHFTDVILRLNEIDEAFRAAQSDHRRGDDSAAMNRYQRAARILEDLRAEKEALYAETVRVWEKSTFPRDYRQIPGGRERYVFYVDRELYYGNKSIDLAYIFEVEERLGLYGYELQLFDTMQYLLRHK